jgi:beta-barrel assembly-enhancing protease
MRAMDRVVMRAAVLAGLAMAVTAGVWAQSSAPAAGNSPSVSASASAPAAQVPANAPAGDSGAQTSSGREPYDIATSATCCRHHAGGRRCAAAREAAGQVRASSTRGRRRIQVKVVEPGSQKIKVKAGSIDDVSAVGNRDIGARGMGNWYSTDTEIKMGKMYASRSRRARSSSPTREDQ